uniref:Glutathione peroxidase n=2 Tax=Meloidogyne TaxID=189290 RepID=A0A915NTP5_9BILA
MFSHTLLSNHFQIFSLLRSSFKNINFNQISCASTNTGKMATNTIYNFVAKDIDEKDVKMGDVYKGRVVLIVNVASECGFTKTNYPQMKVLLEKYKDKGLSVACFPCNQFNSQEPGTNQEIKKFINEKFNFFPDLYAKIDVNGKNAHPLWEFLKHEQHGTLIDAIKWNFTKFLVNKQGIPVSRHAPTDEPEKLEPEIKKLLEE